MPRHPPIALKTLDRSHCQYPRLNREAIYGDRVILEENYRAPCAIPKELSHGNPRRRFIAKEMELAEKTSFSRSVRWPAVKPPIICKGLSVPCDTSSPSPHDPLQPGPRALPSTIMLGTKSPNKSSLYDVMQNRRCASARRKLVFHSNDWLPILSTPKIGGAGRDRTDDPLLAKQVLSQLSYGPLISLRKVVGLGGLEPPTSRLSSARSNQLSYKPLQPNLAWLTPSRRSLARPIGRRGSCRALAERQQPEGLRYGA